MSHNDLNPVIDIYFPITYSLLSYFFNMQFCSMNCRIWKCAFVSIRNIKIAYYQDKST